MHTDHVQFCNSNRLYLVCGIHFISVICLLLGAAIITKSSSLYLASSGATNVTAHVLHTLVTFLVLNIMSLLLC